jgi:ATP-dependent Clp protease ATP-binding subunit ClpA
MAEAFRGPILAGLPAREGIPTEVDLPLTNASKRVLAYSAEEAERLGDRHIRCGHLLLGLMREKGSLAEKLLTENGAELKKMRTRMASEPQTQEPGIGAGKTRVEMRHAGIPQPVQGPDWVRQRETEAPKTGFERYSVKARRVIFFARYEASHFGAGKIEPEHLLLGMIREAAWRIYELLGKEVAWTELAELVKARLEPANPQVATSVDIPLSDDSRNVLKAAEDECDALGGGQIGISHLLLGILNQPDGFPALLLRERGADPVAIRRKMNDAQT